MIEYILPIFIVINLALFLYYTYITSRVLISIKNKSILYINSLIPLAPTTLYTMVMINYAFYLSVERIISLYFIEWMITTPLLLISLSSIKNVELYNYYLLSFLTILMNLSGYISYHYHIANVYILKYVFFGLSSAIYCLIVGILSYLYKIKENTSDTSTQYITLNNNIVYKNLMILTFISWSLYPVIFILYLSSHINDTVCVLGFTVLDLSSKSIFTFITFGYELHKYNIQSSVTNVTRRIIQIHPLPIQSNQAEAGLADYTLSAVPVITDYTGYTEDINTSRGMSGEYREDHV